MLISLPSAPNTPLNMHSPTAIHSSTGLIIMIQNAGCPVRSSYTIAIQAKG